MIVGIDEVGRGAWAGPLVVGAVCLDGALIEGLTDSKLLSKSNREALSQEIKLQAKSVGIGWVSARDIDRIGLSESLRIATLRAMSQINLESVESIIIDGTVNFLSDVTLPCAVTTMKKADLIVPSVSAASIVAKVARDNYMRQCDEVFPGYDFHRHVGYGAHKHKLAIDSKGVVAIHRLSFAPMKYGGYIRDNTTESSSLTRQNVVAKNDSPTAIGTRAEDAAEQHLVRNGHVIVNRNWKTRWCEVDIISEKQKVVYFTEVKFRKNRRQGGGIAAITPKKVRQMKFAAELWLQRHPSQDARLSCIEVTGDEQIITEYIVSIE